MHDTQFCFVAFFKKESFKVRKHMFKKSKCWNSIGSLISGKSRALKILNKIFFFNHIHTGLASQNALWVTCIMYSLGWVSCSVGSFSFYGKFSSSLPSNSCCQSHQLVCTTPASLGADLSAPSHWIPVLTEEVFHLLPTKVNSGIWRKIICIRFCLNLHSR